LTRRENIPRIPAYRNAEPGWPQRVEKASKHRGFGISGKERRTSRLAAIFLSKNDPAATWLYLGK
jgi:hypothetical protein